mmetsp:Transcript_9050/g.29912  ORF Transcript_9050/g.29912 Transcript_9050/m.29912 type:complete len:503 (-) Transcript_9050:923-2431(-)
MLRQRDVWAAARAQLHGTAPRVGADRRAAAGGLHRAAPAAVQDCRPSAADDHLCGRVREGRGRARRAHLRRLPRGRPLPDRLVRRGGRPARVRARRACGAARAGPRGPLLHAQVGRDVQAVGRVRQAGAARLGRAGEGGGTDAALHRGRRRLQRQRDRRGGRDDGRRLRRGPDDPAPLQRRDDVGQEGLLARPRRQDPRQEPARHLLPAAAGLVHQRDLPHLQHGLGPLDRRRVHQDDEHAGGPVLGGGTRRLRKHPRRERVCLGHDADPLVHRRLRGARALHRGRPHARGQGGRPPPRRGDRRGEGGCAVRDGDSARRLRVAVRGAEAAAAALPRALLRAADRRARRNRRLPHRLQQGDCRRKGDVPRLRRPVREVPRPPLRVRPHLGPRRRGLARRRHRHRARVRRGRRHRRGRRAKPRPVRGHGCGVGGRHRSRAGRARGGRVRLPPGHGLPLQLVRRLLLWARPRALRRARRLQARLPPRGSGGRAARQQARLLRVRR